jgi:hypothetical protein
LKLTANISTVSWLMFGPNYSVCEHPQEMSLSSS